MRYSALLLVILLATASYCSEPGAPLESHLQDGAVANVAWAMNCNGDINKRIADTRKFMTSSPMNEELAKQIREGMDLMINICLPNLPPFNCKDAKAKVAKLQALLANPNLPPFLKALYQAHLNWLLKYCFPRHWCKCPASEKERIIRLRILKAAIMNAMANNLPNLWCLMNEYMFLVCCSRVFIQNPICKPWIALQYPGLPYYWDAGNAQCNKYTNNICPFQP